MSDHSFQDLKVIQSEQWQILRKQLEYTAANSPYYRKLFSKKGIRTKDISSFDDFSKIPITTKEDLQQCNSHFIAVPEDEIIDFVTTSGTLGSPVNFALNNADLDRLAENEYRSFRLAGIKKSDTVQITTTLDRRFMAGLAYFLGLRKLGAGIIRTGSGLPELQWESIRRFQPGYLVAVPSFLLKMLQYARENNIDYKNSSVKAVICIGEPLRDRDYRLNALGQKICSLWNIELFSTYASTEMATAFTECSAHKGNHIPADLIYTEILDEKGHPVRAGEIGELVVTPLGTQTMPLLRFATGDMMSLDEAACGCGRNTPRLSAVIGRKQHKMKLKGTSLYPQHLGEVMNRFARIDSYVIIAKTSDLGGDLVEVLVPDTFTQIDELKDYFRSHLQVAPEVRTVNKNAILEMKFPKGSRKPQVFIDKR